MKKIILSALVLALTGGAAMADRGHGGGGGRAAWPRLGRRDAFIATAAAFTLKAVASVVHENRGGWNRGAASWFTRTAA